MTQEVIAVPEDITAQEIAIVQPQPITPAQSEAWLAMAGEKNKLTATLQQMELQAQAILLPVKNSEDYNAIDTALASYRKHHIQTSETRKTFTGIIEAAIIQPLMAFEKRIDPKVSNEYIALSNKSLQLRKAEAEKAALLNAKDAEISSFKAHVQNEFVRIENEYKATIRREFNSYYATCLKAKDKSGYEKSKEFLREIKPSAPEKFVAKYLTNEEMAGIYADIQRPDLLSVYNDLMDEMDTVFANFDSDVANAEAAIKHREDQEKLQAIEAQKKADEERAMNTLIATSETVTIAEPTIKKSVQIVVVESEAWAKSVIAAFITNLPKLAKYIRVKSWSKLSIGQMAEYLSKLATDQGCKYGGLTLKEVEK